LVVSHCHTLRPPSRIPRKRISGRGSRRTNRASSRTCGLASQGRRQVKFECRAFRRQARDEGYAYLGEVNLGQPNVHAHGFHMLHAGREFEFTTYGSRPALLQPERGPQVCRLGSNWRLGVLSGDQYTSGHVDPGNSGRHHVQARRRRRETLRRLTRRQSGPAMNRSSRRTPAAAGRSTPGR